ncbi:hypothetical protein F9278_36250 [Streptomyces phaeolivaceus]|uniref:Uncharacterized protein n=1 Tax=Streptomyces phaeolivaceus TaxID=2653200 RepID=A0A5P8KDX1_9ACTN|nr:hypothetical protein [Streptomyces phaeolivaceus]QFR00730.1 hypothetical protein F9278_36250 [Streptomyces phaeolivaceus]
MEAPKYGTAEYRLWAAGAEAEAKARREGRSKAGLEVLGYVDALAEHRSEMDHTDIAFRVFAVFGLAGLAFDSWRARARLALWVLRNGKGRARRKG